MFKQIKFLLVLFAVLVVASPLNVLCQDGVPQNDATAKRVKKAFDAARNGNYQELSKLTDLGEDVIPYLEPYLFKEKDFVQRQILMLLKSTESKKSLPLMAKALGSKELFPRATELLYESYKPSMIAESPEIKNALLKSFSAGRISTAGILLFGNFPGNESEKALTTAKKKAGNQMGESLEYFLPVPYSLAADVALTQINSQEGIHSLSAAIKKTSVQEMWFLLHSLEFIENKEILRELKNYSLKDCRVFKTGQSEAVVLKPDGNIETEMFEKRLSDIAVDLFIMRFQLDVSFDRTKKQYSKADIAEVDKKLNVILGAK